MGPTFSDTCPYPRKAEGDGRHTDTEGRRPLKTAAEVGGYGHRQGMPGATKTGRRRETSAPQTSERWRPSQYLDFRLLAPKTISKRSFCCFHAMQCVPICHGSHSPNTPSLPTYLPEPMGGRGDGQLCKSPASSSSQLPGLPPPTGREVVQLSVCS